MTDVGRCQVCGAPNNHESYRDPVAHIHAGHPRSIMGWYPTSDGIGVVFVKQGDERIATEQLLADEPPDQQAIPRWASGVWFSRGAVALGILE